MTKNTLAIIAVALVVLGFAGGWFMKPVVSNLGGTVNYSNSLSQLTLYTTLESLLADIGRVRAPGATISLYSSSTMTFASLGAAGVATSTLSSSTAGSYTEGSGGQPASGDLVLVSSNATSGIVFGVVFTGHVTATTGQLIITATQVSSSSRWTGGNVAIKAIVFPSSGFIQPGALQTTSSTSN